MNLVFKQLPVLGPGSVQAAEASQCAATQGKFWEYHDALFATPAASPGGWSPEQLRQMADSVGLDGPAFEQCLAKRETVPILQSDLNEATELEIRSTPAFFLNGELFTGAQPMSVFEEKFNAALLAKGVAPPD